MTVDTLSLDVRRYALEEGVRLDRRALTEVVVVGFDIGLLGLLLDFGEATQIGPFGVDLGGGADWHQVHRGLDQAHVESAIGAGVELAR